MGEQLKKWLNFLVIIKFGTSLIAKILKSIRFESWKQTNHTVRCALLTIKQNLNHHHFFQILLSIKLIQLLKI